MSVWSSSTLIETPGFCGRTRVFRSERGDVIRTVTGPDMSKLAKEYDPP